MKLTLHIDRLVLRGIPAEQRDRVVRALHESLAHQLTLPGAAGLAAGMGHRESLRANLAPSRDPQSLGRAAGLRIGQEMKR